MLWHALSLIRLRSPDHSHLALISWVFRNHLRFLTFIFDILPCSLWEERVSQYWKGKCMVRVTREILLSLSNWESEAQIYSWTRLQLYVQNFIRRKLYFEQLSFCFFSAGLSFNLVRCRQLLRLSTPRRINLLKAMAVICQLNWVLHIFT